MKRKVLKLSADNPMLNIKPSTLDSDGNVPMIHIDTPVEYKTYELTKPTLANDLAKTVATYINTNKLYSDIKGKKYVNVEGWEYAGLQFGLIAMPSKPENLSSDKEVKYSCEVNLINQNGEVRGYGYALCSSKEKSKSYFDEYAICSMAQTRAISKAYRNSIAWLMKMSGFEGTPEEERVIEKDRDIAKELRSCKNLEELSEVWKSLDSASMKVYVKLKDELKDKLMEKVQEVADET